jgi:hypothetical protein
METQNPANRKLRIPSTGLASLVGAVAMLVFASTPSWPATTTAPSVTTIQDVAVKAGAVRVTLVVTLTHAASYRITQPEPDRLAVDFERADFNLAHSIDLKTPGGWITDWAHGFLMFGYTRLSVRFDRKVSVAHDEMTKETSNSLAELLIDVVEAP